LKSAFNSASALTHTRRTASSQWVGKTKLAMSVDGKRSVNLQVKVFDSRLPGVK
jgi:hypothetical protein